jgi:hypothetical protein
MTPDEKLERLEQLAEDLDTQTAALIQQMRGLIEPGWSRDEFYKELRELEKSSKLWRVFWDELKSDRKCWEQNKR